MYQVLKWLNSLELKNSYAQPRYDMANGLLVAEIMEKANGSIKIEEIYDAKKKELKRTNWDFICQVLEKENFKFEPNKKQVIDAIINCESQEICEGFLEQLFTFFTGKEIVAIKYAEKEEPQPKKQTESLESVAPSAKTTEKTSRLEKQKEYIESFNSASEGVISICKKAYMETYNTIETMTMFEVFVELQKIDTELDDCDEELKNVKSITEYEPEILQLFEFANSSKDLQNIFSDSTNEEVCEIFFHEKFLEILEDNTGELLQTLAVNLLSQFEWLMHLINIYYYSENDIIFLENKNFANDLIMQLIELIEEQNRKDTHVIEMMIHEVLMMLPEEYSFASNQFINEEIMLSKVMNSFLPKDNFYGIEFNFLENRMPTSPLNEGIEYEFKRGQVIHETTFVCSLLSKFLIFEPKLVAKMINSYVFEQMNISNYHLLNPMAREYLSNLNDETEEDDFIIVVTEEQQELQEMNNLELLFLDMLIDQFVYSYEYCKSPKINLMDVAEFFIFYACQVDILKFDNTENNLFLFSYITKRKSMVVLYLDILSLLVKLLFFNIEIIEDSEDVGQTVEFVKDFGQKDNSEMSLIFKCVQVLERYIIGMSDKYLKGNEKMQNASFQEQLSMVVENFVCSEADQNIHGILETTSSICESLYDIVERFIDLTLFLYSDRLKDTQIMKYLMEPPTLESGLVDEQFLNLVFIIQELSNVCVDLVDMIELILSKLEVVREDKTQNKTYGVIDMELDEEPLHACMADLHKRMKKIF